MQTWIIEPHDPLIVRDGRPFGTSPGERATSLKFPFPSTTTGGVRTRAGTGNGTFDNSAANIDRVKQITVHGPLLVELSEGANQIAQWFAPTPADVLLFDREQQEADKPDTVETVTLGQLLPHKLPDGAVTNLPNDLLPVCLSQRKPQKVSANSARYWNWGTFERWLLKPENITVQLSELGIAGPMFESRVHLRVDPNTQAAKEGALFQTRGLEFTHLPQKDKDKNKLSSAKRLALAIVTDAEANDAPELSALGGERRLVTWHASPEGLPSLPVNIRSAILNDAACRVILLTPAFFENGFYPTWLCQTQHGVKPTIQAIAMNERAQVVSGWDFEKSSPKPTRRLMPFGSVFFLKLQGDKVSIGEWVDALWMQTISDQDVDRRDGFGLAVLGTWSGHCPTLEI